MKPVEIRPGDRLRVRPWFSTTPEHWGTFSHCHRGGALVYAPDFDARIYRRCARLVKCFWYDVAEIVRGSA